MKGIRKEEYLKNNADFCVELAHKAFTRNPQISYDSIPFVQIRVSNTQYEKRFYLSRADFQNTSKLRDQSISSNMGSMSSYYSAPSISSESEQFQVSIGSDPLLCDIVIPSFNGYQFSMDFTHLFCGSNNQNNNGNNNVFNEHERIPSPTAIGQLNSQTKSFPVIYTASTIEIPIVNTKSIQLSSPLKSRSDTLLLGQRFKFQFQSLQTQIQRKARLQQQSLLNVNIIDIVSKQSFSHTFHPSNQNEHRQIGQRNCTESNQVNQMQRAEGVEEDEAAETVFRINLNEIFQVNQKTSPIVIIKKSFNQPVQEILVKYSSFTKLWSLETTLPCSYLCSNSTPNMNTCIFNKGANQSNTNNIWIEKNAVFLVEQLCFQVNWSDDQFDHSIIQEYVKKDYIPSAQKLHHAIKHFPYYRPI